MNSKYIKWSTLAFMAFSTVWGFGNVVNGFVYFNGIQVIFSWIFMFALYFIPYALMVLDPEDYRSQTRLLRRLDILGLPYHLYRK